MRIEKNTNIVRRMAEVPQSLKDLIAELETCPVEELPSRLEAFSSKWGRPRGDMCPWVPLLNRFDDLLSDAVQKYGLDKTYLEPTPVDANEERLIISILDFTAFLLEKCSNRGIYSSVKQVSQMLGSISPSIVSAALRVCVKLGQRYAQSRAGRANLNAIDPNTIVSLATLLPLAQWDEAGKPLVTLRDWVSPNFKFPDEFSAFSLQYYVKSEGGASKPHPAMDSPATPTRPSHLREGPPPTGSGSGSTSTNGEGLTTLYLSPSEVSELPADKLLERIYTTLPKDQWFTALNTARVSKACINSEQGYLLRLELLKVQFLALSYAVCVHGRSQVFERILNKLPNIFKQISDLVAPESTEVPQQVKVLALQTIDNLCNLQEIVPDILTALSANVSHGTLMSLIRNTITDLKRGAEIDEDFTSELFMVILQLTSGQGPASILVTAGLIPLLLEVIQLHGPYVRTAANVLELLDHIVMDIPSTFPPFVQAKGIDIMVEVIQKEIEFDISPEMNETPPDYCVVDFSLSYYRSQWVRALLGFIGNIMSHARSSARIHNLLDSPLIQVSQKIMLYPKVLGSRILSLNLLMLATLLENEPSSFGVMHEAKLIDTVLETIPDLLKMSNSYFSPIAKFINALCHSEGGLQVVQGENLLVYYFDRLLESIVSNDGLKNLGTTFDLISSEHPPLRPILIREVLKLLEAIPAKVATVSRESRFYAESEVVSKRAEQEFYSGTPELMTVVNNVIGFFEGFLKNHLTRVEFIKQHGVTQLLDLFELANLPYDFAFSSAAYALSGILRSLFDLDINTDYIQVSMISKINSSLARVEEHMGPVSTETPIGHQEVDLDQLMRAFGQLNSFLFAFRQMVFVNSATGYRIAFVLDKLMAPDSDEVPSDLLERLGAIQRWSIWQESLSVVGVPQDVIEATQPVSIEESNRSFRNIYELDEFKKIKEAAGKLDEATVVSDDFVRLRTFRFLSRSACNLSCRVLFEFASFSTNDRTMSTRKKNGLKMADSIAHILIEHLGFSPILAVSDSELVQARYQAIMTTMATIQKILLRPWNNTLTANLGVLIHFKQKMGVNKTVDVLNSLWTTSVPEDEADSQNSKSLLACQKVILLLLSFLVSQRSVLENSRSVTALSSRESEQLRRDFFSPSQFFVELRIIVLYSLVDLWQSDLLEKKDLAITQLFLDIMSKLLTPASEDGIASRLDRDNLPRELSWKYVTPSEDKVEALVALGYEERAARRSLELAEDNINLAKDELGHSNDDNPGPTNAEFEIPTGYAPAKADGTPLVSVSDLQNMRDNVKTDLIDKCLNIIQDRTEVVYSVSSLITKAYSLPISGGGRSEKQKESLYSSHKDIVTTILQALSSLDSSVPENSSCIAAIAYLLGLIIQDQTWFSNCFEDLTEFIDLFAGLLRHENAVKEKWYPYVLLIVEKLMANLAVPKQSPRKYESSIPEMFKAVLPSIPEDVEQDIFETLVKPQPFEDDTSALAVARLMVHFSKDHSRATRILTNGMMLHLLHATKQFADSPNFEKLQTTVFIILRHAVETPELIQEIMMTEIKSYFAVSKVTDAVVFIKSNYHMVSRSPKIFVDVVSELCTFHDMTMSNWSLCTKEYADRRVKRTVASKDRVSNLLKKDEQEGSSDSKDNAKAAKEDSKDEDAMSDHDDNAPAPPEPSSTLKVPPMSGNNSGVINLLLTELISLKKDEVFIRPERTEAALQEEIAKNEKLEFKASENKTYVYCCTLLQALMELLASYNRCKMEFICFSKQNILNTARVPPSKPRSYALNYFLHELVPTGVLYESYHLVLQQWQTVSNLASAVVMNLLFSTAEKGRKSRPSPEVQNDAVLVFVRKFALDTFSKALRELDTNCDSTDMKYSKLAAYAELCYRLLSTKTGSSIIGYSTDLSGDSASVAKIMYDKRFAQLFTANLGEMDLNYPYTKKVVRTVLRYLNKMGRLAIDVTDNQDRDVEEDFDAELEALETDSDDYYREDTPDLFRNSTLGMFEAGENMYDDEELDDAEEEDLEEEDGVDYDEVHDDMLSDVDDDDAESDENMMQYDEDEEFDESESNADDDMSIEIEIGEDVSDGEDGDDYDEDDESDWESIEDADELDEEDEHIMATLPSSATRDAELEAMPSAADDTVTQQNIFDEEDGDILYTGRNAGGPTDFEGESTDDEDEDDEENTDGDFDMDYDYIDMTQPIHRIGTIRYDRPTGNQHNEVVSNPLLSQPRPQSRGATVVMSRHGNRANGGLSAYASLLDSLDDSRLGANAVLSDMLGQFTELLADTPQPDDFFDISQLFPGADLRRSTARMDGTSSALMKDNIVSTNGRWQEAALMFGVYSRIEIAGRVLNDIYNGIFPYASEMRKKLEELETELKSMERVLKERKEEAERKEREKREEEERQRKEQEEEERRRKEQEEEAKRLAESQGDEDVDMGESAGAEESSEPTERQIVSIGGEDVDITGLGMDPSFLEALPADMREEVFTQHIRDMRARNNEAEAEAEADTSATEGSRALDPEFLDALPENIREELLAQEAIDNRAQRLRASAMAGGEAGADGEGHGVDMDLASFLATLDPGLRQTLLLEQDDLSLAELPSEIAQEARELRSRTVANFGGAGRDRAPSSGNRSGGEVFPALFRAVGNNRSGDLLRTYDSDEESEAEGGPLIDLSNNAKKEKAKHQVAAAALSLVERPGVASLVRLLFFPLGGHILGNLHDLLLSLCSNKQNRLDILSMLLHLLQDASTDRYQLEKGFVHATNRSRGPVPITNTPIKGNAQTPKTPSKVTLGSGGAILKQEVSSVSVMQQAIDTLESLVANSGNVKYFFLSEHEFPVGQKRARSKSKGKEREKDAPREWKFPINLLLSLLERDIVKKDTATMEMYASLLHEVTRSLPALLKREKEKEEGQDDKDKEEPKEEEESKDAENKDKKDKKKDKEKEKEKEKEKKLIDPPYIPEYNLRKVSSILSADDCSGKTFQQILAVMQHLSALPKIKEFFGKELLEAAVELGPQIISDLHQLIETVKHAEKGSDIQGSSLANFSSKKSKQAKLLRVLTAIDYLFDNRKDSSSSKEDQSQSLKALYESMTFGPLWGSLSDCLRLVQDKQDMIHVATALLPLIESLMVICKRSKVKEVQLRDKYEAKRPDIATEPLESLFFSFTDEHRKILNQIVRNNPQLMIGSFSILVKNPKALEFDNKRRYFYRKLYPNNETPSQTVSLNVRRDQVFLDSYKALYFKSAEEIKNSRLNVRFQGEEGVDAGGVAREWYQVLSRQMFNPDYALFTPVAADRTTFHPNRTSWVNPEHLSFFKFIGRIIGKAINDFKVLDCHFSRAVYKKILGKAVSLKDMETLDLDYHKSLVWMLENDITDIITETFSIEADDYGEQKVIDLKPGGRDIPVTEENKREYVSLVVDYRLLRSVQEQMDHFLEGFHDIIPKEVVSIFDEQELELLISGMPDIDLDDWRNNTVYHNYTPSSPQVKWFWRAVRSFDAEEKAKLLQFATGTSKVPLNGFGSLEGMNGVSKFNIHRDFGSKDRLPSSHTCFNQIDLPEYDSYETLRGSLLMAITEGKEGFGFA